MQALRYATSPTQPHEYAPRPGSGCVKCPYPDTHPVHVSAGAEVNVTIDPRTAALATASRIMRARTVRR